MNRILVAMAAIATVMGAFVAPAQAATYQLDAISASTFVPGDSATVHGNGFLPGGTVQLILKGGGASANGQSAGDLVVATFTANADGVIDGPFTIPVTVALGTYLLQLTGPNYGGSGTQVISFSVKVSTTRTPATVALPQTGSDSSRFSTIATVAGVLGVAMVLGTRRRRSHLRVSA